MSTAKGTPLVLGLSHLFGETLNMDQRVSYWQAQGLLIDFSLDLPVPEEKRKRLLNNQSARWARLVYMRFPSSAGGWGLEFVTHAPPEQAPLRGTCVDKNVEEEIKPSVGTAIRLAVQAPRPAKWRDPDGGELIFETRLCVPTSVLVKTPSIDADGAVLETLGFVHTPFSVQEMELLKGLCPGVGGGWFFQSPLFPQRAVRVVLEPESRRAGTPKVDDLGFSGISLLTKDLDEVGRHLPLAGRQRFRLDSREHEVAFYGGQGLVVEMLQVRLP